MQEEVDEKTVALVINGGKISGRILKAALEKMVHGIEEKRRLTGSETEAQRKEEKTGCSEKGRSRKEEAA